MPDPARSRIDAFYGDFQALFGVSLRVEPGEVVAVIGANGAGKSTLLRTIAGLMHRAAATIVFDGEPIGGAPAYAVVRRGIAMVPEGRRLFPSLTVEENLHDRRPVAAAGAVDARAHLRAVSGAGRAARICRRPALSGGQQQMAAIARALMANPRLLLCDEISLGLAPIIVRDIYARLPEIAAEGLSLIIVEQDIVQALQAAAACLLPAGRPHRAAGQGRASFDARARSIARAYFGV